MNPRPHTDRATMNLATNLIIPDCRDQRETIPFDSAFVEPPLALGVAVNPAEPEGLQQSVLSASHAAGLGRGVVVVAHHV